MLQRTTPEQQMVEQAATRITRLPHQLLVNVLKHVDPRERLGSCALVCRTCHAAAAAATSSIEASSTSWVQGTEMFQSSSSWLQAYGQAAPVEAITVSCHPNTKLYLPVQQLAALRELNLTGIQAIFTDRAADHPDTTTQLPVELSALTRSQLNSAHVQLDALPAFTQQQHLGLVRTRYGLQHNPESAVLASALPSLRQLTHLELQRCYTSDAVLSGVQHLSCLQELILQDTICSAGALADAPRTLTKLVVEQRVSQSEQFAFRSRTTPWLTELTCLQHLELARASSVQITAVAGLVKLTHLSINDSRLLPADAAATPTLGLTALTALTGLQHLDLQCTAWGLENAVDSPAGFAALTSSTQLTYLDVSSGLVAARSYIHMFPPGRQRPVLRELHATTGLVGEDLDDAIYACAQCCPNLEVLDLSRDAEGEPAAAYYYDEKGEWHHSVAHLRRFTNLTTLKLQLENTSWGFAGWYDLAQVTTLRDLDLSNVPDSEVTGVMELTSCRQLTRLGVDIKDRDNDEGEFVLLTQAPAGSAPDVWCKLPEALLDTVVTLFRESDDDWLQRNTALLCDVAAAHSKVMAELQEHVNDDFRQQLTAQQQQHQQELAGLRAALEAQQRLHQQLQQQQLQQLQQQQLQQQQLAAMQASLAALAAQIPSLQQQQEQ